MYRTRTPWSVRSVAAMLAIGAPLGAQSVGGVVRDSAGVPIANALVSIEALSRSTTTDSSGHYSLSAAAGLRLMQVRRVGFTGASRMVQVKEGATADFVLARVIVTLDTVRRIEQYKATDLPMMEFLDNRKMGLGHFVSRAALDSMRGRHLGEALCCIPGTLYVTEGSISAYLASSRSHSLGTNCFGREDATVDCRRCYPDVYMDFQRLSYDSIGVVRVVPNLNRYTPETLEAVEVYAGPAELPARYISSKSQCGTIILHSRRSWP